MKTKKELNALKKQAETVSKKPCALTDEEAAQVSGGVRGIVTFKIDAPSAAEADVVELNVSNVSISKGEILVPAQIIIQE